MKTEKGIAMRYKGEPLKLIESHTSVMLMCRCGDVFRASGRPEAVEPKQQKWQARHEHCADKPGDKRKVFWLSFCAGDKPEGSQFLGACLVEVTADEADLAAIEMMLQFPFAQPDAKWIAAATKNAWALGCNPGGEIASMEVPIDHPMLAKYQFGVLMDRATIERLDRELEH